MSESRVRGLYANATAWNFGDHEDRPELARMREAHYAEFDRFIAKVKADERRSLLEELTTDAEQEASIGRQGNDSERVNAAEKIIEMLNDIQIEGEE